MRKILPIILCACCFVCSAKQYKITSFKDVQIRVGNKSVEKGFVFDMDSVKIEAAWQNSDGFYILNEVSTGVTKVVRPVSTQSANKSEGYISKLKKFLTSVKNCSSRAAENELLGGLDSYLSQTFYLSLSDENLSKIYVASDLAQNEKCYFKVRMVGTKAPREIRLTPGKGVRITLDDVKRLTGSDKPARLRCRVSYISANGEEIVITETMNIILLP